MKKILNKFVNWYYKKEITEAKEKVISLGINEAIYYLEDLKKIIHPKTDAIKELEKLIESRINPFSPKNINPKIQAYINMQKIGGYNH